MSSENLFFTNLPPNKTKGFCEATEGDPDHTRVVVLEEECITCESPECHMFVALTGKGGKIIGRFFKVHPPEYPTVEKSQNGSNKPV